MGTKKSGGEAISPVMLRAFWAERQQLAVGTASATGATAADVLAKTGWARSVGGCNPYLALWARAGLSREAVDRAVKELEVHELTAARGCTYVVPRADYAVALRASQGHGDDASIAQAKKYLAVTDKEIDRLCQRVLDAIAKGPLDPAAIKETVGDAVRSLGAEGKKRGLGSTLPLALGRLQTHGLVRRVSIDGRLDQQRYRYARWDVSPLSNQTFSDEAIAIELARRFFRWAGPATIAQLTWWAGLGVKAARAAAAEVRVVALEEGSDRLLFEDDRDALRAMAIPRDPCVAFVSSLDNLLHLRREVRPHLEAIDLEREVPGEGSRKSEAAGSLAELPYHPIIDRGRIIGLWDWDGVKGELVWRTFVKAGAMNGAPTREESARVAKYIARELGDLRSFSLDSPEKRVAGIDALRRVKW
jgi:hypothetical protein